MKQIWFQTNLDFDATIENLKELRSHGLIKHFDEFKGRCTFALKQFRKVIIQITKKGKLGLYYSQEQNVSIVIDELLKNCLLTEEGKPAEILHVLYSSDASLETEFEEPFYIPPPVDFRIYREAFERLANLRGKSPSKIRKALHELCSACINIYNKKLALPKVCRNCNSSLQDIVEHKLAPYFTKRVPLIAILVYLYCEYKTALFISAIKEIKRALNESTDKEFDMVYVSIHQRVFRLDDWDASLEPKIKEWVLGWLPIIDLRKAKKAVRICMEAVKWHLIHEITWTPSIKEEADRAYEKFEKEGMKIILEAARSPKYRDSRKIYKKAVKRALKRFSLGSKSHGSFI